MDSFQKTVLGISVIILVLILVGVGIMMSISTYSSAKIFPPVQQSCPDGWNSDASGNCYYVGKNGGQAFNEDGTTTSTGDKIASLYPVYKATVNSNGNLSISGSYPFGVSSTPPINSSMKTTVLFNNADPAWTKQGGTTLCAQKKFANQYSIYWDGISNTNQCSK